MRKQQLEHLRTPAMRERVSKTLVFLRQEAKELARLLRQTIQADAALAPDFALLTSMPGCGPILAATLLAELPELGSLDRRKVASPRRPRPGRQGQRPARAQTRHQGRPPQVRRALYMAAVASLRIKASPAKARYDQLIARGKAPKLALTALMRKMLVALNAMLKTRQAWKDPRKILNV